MFDKKPEFAAEITLAGLFEPHALFTWKGRRNRQRFFIIGLFTTIGSTISSILLVNSVIHRDGSWFIWGGLILLIAYVAFCNLVKRFHDMGHTMKPALVCLAASLANEYMTAVWGAGDFSGGRLICLAITLFFGLYCLFVEGTKGDNPYGPDILLEEAEEKVAAPVKPVVKAGEKMTTAEEALVTEAGKKQFSAMPKVVGNVPVKPAADAAEPALKPLEEPVDADAKSDVEPVEKPVAADAESAAEPVEKDEEKIAGKATRNFCSMCGEKVSQRARFCPYCGAKLQG